MRANLFLTVLLIFVAQITFAQMMEPVKWSFASEKVSEKEYDIVFTAKIESGWFVYSQFLKSGGPIPTSFNFSNTSDLQLIGKTIEKGTKKVVFDELFGMDLIKFSNKVLFSQRVKIKDSSRPIKGFLTFMTCDNESCLPPTNINFEIPLK